MAILVIVAVAVLDGAEEKTPVESVDISESVEEPAPSDGRVDAAIEENFFAGHTTADADAEWEDWNAANC